MDDIEKAILYGLEALMVRLHVVTCLECKDKFEEIKKHIKETVKNG